MNNNNWLKDLFLDEAKIALTACGSPSAEQVESAVAKYLDENPIESAPVDYLTTSELNPLTIEIGSIDSAKGVNITGKTRLRSIGFLSNDIKEIVARDGYKICVYAWKHGIFKVLFRALI